MAENTSVKKKTSKKISKPSKDKAKNDAKAAKSEDEVDDLSSASSVSEKADKEEDEDQIGHKVGAAAITISREEYLQAHRDLTFDKQQLQMKNNILHRRLADYYKKRKMDHVLKALEGAVDLEEKYQQKLLSYEELKEKEEREMAEIKSKLEVVDIHYRSRLEHAEQKFDDLQQLEQTTGTGLIYSKKGKPIADKTVHRYLVLQRRKTEQASGLCLRYIRVRNAVSELEAIVRKLEQIAPGLFVAQYEQLFVDHQNFATKVEEREDELIKNRVKCTEHNQILAHIREKMQHTDEVIEFTECDLGEAEMDYQAAREELGQVKTRRDKLRWSLETERLKAGLLTRKDLLRDYEHATDEVEILKKRKSQLEHQIVKATNDLREARKRVQLSRTPSVPSNNDQVITIFYQSTS